MTIYEIAKRAVDTWTAQKLRHREGNQYDCQVVLAGNNKGWTLLDVTTASAIVQIYEKLKPKSRDRYMALPLSRMIDITWRIVGSVANT